MDMNYGKKLLYTICCALGMVVAITGLGYYNGYFSGHSQASGAALGIVGLVVTVWFLYKLIKTK